MKSFVRFTLKQTVFINVVFVILTIAGIFSLVTTPVENMPPVDIGKVFITTVYYGASADDVEKLVTNEIEDAIDGLENVEYVQSRSMRNASTVEVKFIDDTDYRRQYDELRFRILNIRSQLPADVDDPVFTYIDTKVWIPVIIVNLVGDLSNRTLKLMSEELKSNLIKIDGVQEVQLAGEYTKEFHVALDPGKLRDRGVSFSEVAQAIRSVNTKIPSGRFRKDTKNLMLDTGSTLSSQREVLDIVVRKDGDGNFIHVRDLTVAAGMDHRDPDVISTVNAQSTIKLLVKKEDSANAVTIAETVKRMAARFEKEHKKDGLSTVMSYDSTIEIHDSVQTLGGNMLLGMTMVTLILWITLGFRNSMLTAIGIPFSFLVTLIIVKHTGQSINTISLFSFVLVSGIIVDDAIVIVENIYRHLEMGKTRKDAVIDGTSEVMLPVISSALTTIMAFTPMLIMTGSTGAFFSVIPKAVSFALTASLLEALFILPVHVFDWGPKVSGSGVVRYEINDEDPRYQDHGLFTPFWKIYYALLSFLLDHKVITAAGITVVFITALVMMMLSVTGILPLIKIQFFQDSYLRYHIALEMPTGTSVEGTNRVVTDISRFIQSFGDKQVQTVNGSAGLKETKDYAIQRAQHYGQVVVELPPQEQRDLPGIDSKDDASGYIDLVRDKVAAFVDAHYQEWGGRPVLDVFGENTGPPTGKAVNIRVSANTIEEAQAVSDRMLAYLRQDEAFQDLVNLDDNRADMQTVVRYVINQKKAFEYGLDTGTATGLITGALNGMPAGKFRTDSEEIDLLVKLARQGDRLNPGGTGLANPADVLEVPIVEHSASPVYFGDITTGEYVPEPDIRTRYNGKPTITITADIRTGSKKLSAGRVQRLASRYFGTLSSEYPGVTLNFGGEYESTSRAYTSLMFAFLIAVMAIYLILASQFNSYLQPIIILSAIGFAFIGVVFGMFFTQSLFTIGSFMAVIGLAGVAVNDSLILIDFMNKQKAKGIALREAVITACSERMRPVLITTATTILGMLPMAIGIPRKSVTWAPMATAFSTGLATATLLALLIIPVEYELTERLKIRVGSFFRRRILKKYPQTKGGASEVEHA